MSAENYTDNCSVCGDPLESYAPVQHLPPSWTMLVDEEHGITGYRTMASAFVQVCDDCVPEFDHKRLQTWMCDNPDALTDPIREYATQIEPDDILNVKY